MTINMDLPLAPQAAPYRRDPKERHAARLITVVAEGGYLRVVVQLHPPLRPVMQQGRGASLRNALAVLLSMWRAVRVRRHATDRAAVNHVDALRGGAEGRQADAARRRLAAVEVVLRPRVAGARAPRPPPRGALLPGRLGPVQRRLALQPEESVDERGETDGARGDEPAQEVEPGGVKQMCHAHEQGSHQVHGSSPGLSRGEAEPAAATARMTTRESPVCQTIARISQYWQTQKSTRILD